MAFQRPLISVICCAHNEEEYVNKSIPALLKALKGLSSEIIFVADRCTDNTVIMVNKYKVKIIEKKWKKWKNSYAESLQTGFFDAKGIYLGIVDVDIAVSADFFTELLPVIKGDIASVSARVVTYSDTFWNRLTYVWEKTRNLAPLGREPWGAARIIRKDSLDVINGFRDVPTPDTDIDIRLAREGHRSTIKSEVEVYHLRHLSLRKMVSGQIVSGRGRYALGVGLFRTMGHALFRFRPFVVGGWFMEFISNKWKEGEN